MLGDEDETLPSYEDDVNIGHDNDSQSNGPVEPSGGVIDLIQAIRNSPHRRYQHKDQTVVEGYDSKGVRNPFHVEDRTCKVSTLPVLELSLRRFYEIEDKRTLNHSNASALLRCV